MTHRFADVTFTNRVKAVQEQYGSRAQNERMHTRLGPNDTLTQRETGYIAERDSFYIASVGATGWPYVQHRGGPPGFLKVLSPERLAWADYRGNTQLISVGNVSENDRCSLILMDYPNRRRLKILGHMRVEDARTVHGSVASTDRTAGLPCPHRAGRVHRRRGVRLELSAAHHAPVYGSGVCGAGNHARGNGVRLGNAD